MNVTPLSNIILSMDNTATLVALRALGNTCLFRAINFIRYDLRLKAKRERDASQSDYGLDQRNENDAQLQDADEILEERGFDKEFDPGQAAFDHGSVYHWTRSEVETLTGKRTGLNARKINFDMPMELEPALEFMQTNNEKPLTEDQAKTLSVAMDMDVATIHLLKQQAVRAQQVEMLRDTPEIRSTFNGWGDHIGNENSLDELDIVSQHQIAVKLIEKMAVAANQVIKRALQYNRYDDIGDRALIKAGINELTQWVAAVEDRYSPEIDAALAAGRNLRSTEDGLAAAAAAAAKAAQ